jgi:hypothetical protein
MKSALYFYIFSMLLFCNACTENISKKVGAGPIVFGDSSLIVTEKNPHSLFAALGDEKKIETIKVDTQAIVSAVKKSDDSEEKKSIEIQNEVKSNELLTNNFKGVIVEFDQFSVGIEDIKAVEGKLITKGNANQVRLNIKDKSVDGKALIIEDAVLKELKVRTSTKVLFEFAGRKHVLDGLGIDKGTWKSIKLSGKNVQLDQLNKSQLSYDVSFNTNQLKKAITQLSKAKKWNKKDEQKALQSVKALKKYNQYPLSIDASTYTIQMKVEVAQKRVINKTLNLEFN